jgi:hypothetical protein
MPREIGNQTVPTHYLPTIFHLVGVARQSGLSTATARTIHGWRERGIISSEPTRYGKQYRYPLAAIGEVDCQVRWGRRRISPDLLTAARYIEAGTVPNDDALSAFSRLLESLRTDAINIGLVECKQAVARAEGLRAARARGDNALVPRVVRMTQDERDTAFVYMFKKLLGVDDDQSNDGRFELERLIGARSGHGGPERDLSELLPPVNRP